MAETVDNVTVTEISNEDLIAKVDPKYHEPVYEYEFSNGRKFGKKEM